MGVAERTARQRGSRIGLSVEPLGFVVAAAVTFAEDPVLMSVVWVTVVFLIAEGFENFVFTPWVMKEGVSLHPLTVLFSIMFWAAALGIFGALIAIPLTLIAKILLRELVLPLLDEYAAFIK